MANISGTDGKTNTTTASTILLATSTSSTSSLTSSTQPCNSLAFNVEKQNSNSLPSPVTEVTTAVTAASIHHFIAVDSITNSKRKPQMEIEEEELLDAVTFPVDEIPEPIKVLDDIISAFEDTASRRQLQSSGENQSEDDGYMSLSRKNKRNSEEMSQASSNCIPLVTCNESFDADTNELNGNCKKIDLSTITTINVHLDPSDLMQTTLPKARAIMSTSSSNNSNYSSLPCCGQRTTTMVSVGETKTRVGSCNGERNALGIDISAVHKAVLRGSVAKLAEPMLNEHPITIYPGRCSPAKDNGSGGPGNRPKRLLSSVEKHKEVCHILNPNSTSISSSSSSSSPASSDPTSDNQKTQSPSSQNTSDKSFQNSSDDEQLSEDSVDGITVSSESTQLTPSGIAWEIHFKNFKKKAKQLKQEPYISPKIKVKQGLPRLEKNTRKPCIDSHITMQMSQSTEEEFRNFEENAEILNSCVYRHSSMLGKGTFIIRRGSTKKLPKAMDIFSDYPIEKHNLSESEPDADSESEHGKYLPHVENLENLQAEEIKEPTDRHSLGMVKPMISPRDRLSLNIEPQHHQNSLKVDYSPVRYPNKDTSGELVKAVKKCSIKSLEGLLSAELLNDMKISPTQEEPSLGFDIQPKLNQTEGSSLYMYKGAASGNPTGTDYNAELRSSNSTTPHTDLAPTLEEDEEQLSDMSYSCGPLKQIESNISALLRGEMAVIRMADIINPPPSKRPLEFRPGVHKSESAKEMLLSQNAFGPLPPSPPSSNPDIFDYDDLPLPPSPGDDSSENDDIKSPMTPYLKTTAVEVHTRSMSREELHHSNTKERENIKPVHRHMSDELPLPPPPTTFENLPPAVPPHRNGHSANTMKSWSIDSNYRRKSPRVMGYGSGVTTPTSSHGPTYEGSGGGGYGTRRYVSYGTKRSLKQSPREEHRLQTSCSLPETPIFARGCDIPRTPYRRTPNETTPIGSRTAPRSNTSNNINMGNSVLGISGGNTYGGAMCRQRSINHALASNEMLRLSGAPQRGWYPKQRSMRPASTENIDRINTVRVWDGTAAMSGTGPSRKPLTLPPNLTPSFLNQSPREALRRVTSLLITKKKSSKEKRNKSVYSADHALDVAPSHYQDIDKVTTSKPKTDSKRSQNPSNEKPKKKGIFKTLWKRTKHFSLDQ
uniref:Uncharacterized protein n=1 Tax=Glossina brevipalpis TaxID=37001 RepID=A0A1A9VZY2_9MUSC